MDDKLTQATQPATQDTLDPRRMGLNNSGLNESDISDVLCILHPSTPAAFDIVARTAVFAPQHVLRNDGCGPQPDNDDLQMIGDQETFVLPQNLARPSGRAAPDLALRFSSVTLNPRLGFVFGRNAAKCDIILADETGSKRISNLHFRVFVNNSGIIMIEDLSTNGTLVDEVHLKGKDPKRAATRMLNAGSIIQIPSTDSGENVRFVLRIPSRDGFVDEYVQKFHLYMQRVHLFQQEALGANVARGISKQPAGPPLNRLPRPPPPPNLNSNHGMHWNGGKKYNVTGLLGKGAFAIVYQLATKENGTKYAAKELEKKRFMKNGVLDMRIDNEMQIMRSLRHDNIVQYVEFHDTPNHLYIIMEYVEYGDLQSYMQVYGFLPEEQAKTMTVQIFSALAYLHKKKITHRDIKPDNILVASFHPFVVKLSDFGLSKVVKNPESFLKTFCGTLLYCAPEVFPHYDEYVANRGAKRRRGTQQQVRRSYSQAVDIWSYAAVLWYTLCGKPPYEGIADNTGRSMFYKIMESPLNIGPLRQRRVSNEGIDLLIRMLNTDPALRPTETDCLQHPWFRGMEIPNLDYDEGLDAIPEDDEELDASNLSLYDPRPDVLSSADELDMDEESSPLDPRAAKRTKMKGGFESRQQEQYDSSTSSHHLILLGDAMEDTEITPRQPEQRIQNRLFGDTGEMGVLGAHTNLAHAVAVPPSCGMQRESTPTTQSFDYSEVQSHKREGVQHQHHPKHSAKQPDPRRKSDASSLFGAESHFRELNMASPACQTPNNPGIPRTPGSSFQPSADDRLQDVTPKAPTTHHHRRINPPVPPSSSHDPYRLSAHGFQDTPKVSGDDNANDSASSRDTSTSLAPTQPNTIDLPISNPSGSARTFANIANTARTERQPLLGKLTSVPGSILSITLALSSRFTRWGRNLHNEIVYPDKNDTRIAKEALHIWFHAKGIEDAEERGQDWTTMPGLNAFVTTKSKYPILVNGIPLRSRNSKGEVEFGKVYSKDEICVHRGPDGSSLTFVCDFYFGDAKRKRSAGASRFIVERERNSAASGSQKSSQKSR